jgi:hypothetical protein
VITAELLADGAKRATLDEQATRTTLDFVAVLGREFTEDFGETDSHRLCPSW